MKTLEKKFKTLKRLHVKGGSEKLVTDGADFAALVVVVVVVVKYAAAAVVVGIVVAVMVVVERDIDGLDWWV